MTSTQTPPAATRTAATPMARRAATSSFLGSLVEYYDYFLFATGSAVVFAPLFYGPLGDTGALFASFATFAVAYVARPVGAIVFGLIGDRLGRKRSLMASIVLMGVATTVIGLLPTTAQIGMVAPAILVLARICQGLSAGGEQAGSNALAMEHAPDGRRGFFTSWSMQGTVAGIILGSGAFVVMTAVMSADDFAAWGWRIPFLIAAPLTLVAFYLRRRVDETSSFSTASASSSERFLLWELLRTQPGALVRVIGTNFISVFSTTVSVFGLNVWVNQAHAAPGDYLLAGVVANAVALITQPLWATLSDRVGRRPVLAGSLVLVAILFVPYFLIVSGGMTALLFPAMILFSIVFSAGNAVQASFYAEQFPARLRFTGMALGMQLGILLGGFTPMIQQAVTGAFGTASWVMPTLFTSLMCLIAAACAFSSRETHSTTLKELDQ